METENKPLDEFQQLAVAAKPLVDYLNENHHPHVTAIVTNKSVEIMEGLKFIPFTEKPADVTDVFETLSGYFKP